MANTRSASRRYHEWHVVNETPTNAVNSWGLDMSPGLACLSGAEVVGVLSRDDSVFDMGFAGVEAGVTLSGRAEDGGMIRF